MKNIIENLKVCSLAGYDDGLLIHRSGVQIPSNLFFFEMKL